MPKWKEKCKNTIEKRKESLSSNPRVPVITALLKRSRDAQLPTLASSVSYYLLLAIFPFVLLFSSIATVSGIINRLDANVLLTLEEILPSPVFTFLAEFLRDNLGGNTIPVLSASTVMALWAASKGMGVLIRGLWNIYHGKKTSFPFVWRAVGLIFTLVLCISIILSLSLLAFGDVLMQQLREWTGIGFFTENWLKAGRIVGSYLFLFFFFSSLYRAVGMKKTTYRKCLPGAGLAALSWLLFSVLFSWYVANADKYSLFYGSVAGIVILLLWIYFCSFSLLCGGLFNVLWNERKEGKIRV